MKIIVCGGRNYSNEKFIFDELDKLNSECHISLLIEGGAKGADSLAGKWALSRLIPLQVVLPELGKIWTCCWS